MQFLPCRGLSRKRFFQLSLILCFLLGLCITIYLAESEWKIKNTRWVTEEHVIISEVCAHNTNLIYDAFGRYKDYIELYNPTNDDISLNGYSLSDGKKDLQRYIFPDVTIHPNEYFLVFCIDIGTNYFDNHCYANFSVSDGETVYLCDAEGELIDHIETKHTEDNASLQRVGNGRWRTLKGTPMGGYWEAFNDNKKPSDTPVISVDSGFYAEKIYVEINSFKGYEIRYTLDGTTPSFNSSLYENAILIEDRSDNPNKYANIEEITLADNAFFPEKSVEKATVLKAIAIDNNGVQSDVATAVYFIGFQHKPGYNSLPTLSLVFDEADLFSYEKGIYILGQVYDSCKDIPYTNYIYTCPTNYNSEGRGWRRTVKMNLFDEKGNAVDDEIIEAEIHGGWSRVNTQKSFNLLNIHSEELDQMFGRSVDSLVLHAGQNHESVILDKITQDLVTGRSITTQQAYLVQVFLNGEYWGVYLLQDRVDKDLISDRYGVDVDNVILMKNNVVIGDDVQLSTFYEELLKFAQENDLSNAVNYDIISQMMDIQSYIDFVSCEVYIANCDSFNNNYAVWRTKNRDDNNQYADNRWRWILFDTEVGCREETNYEGSGVSFDSGGWSTKPTELVLFSNLLANEQFKIKFIDSFKEMAEVNYSEDRAEKMINDLLSKDGCVDSIVEDHRRFYRTNYTEEDYLNVTGSIIKFFSKRHDYIMPKLSAEIVNE